MPIPSLATRLVPDRRTKLITDLLTIMPDTRLLWLPQPGDTTNGRTFETWPGRVVTYDATVAARLSQLGNGVQQSFASASSQYGTIPDAANLSFGNGTADQAFSLVALANPTSGAANRDLVTKYDTSNREWILRINTADKLVLFLVDESANITINRISDAAVLQGAFHTYGASYNGAGGAAAADGITLYVDGAVIASTATNNASYVAMENLAAPVEIGSVAAHTTAFFNGSIALKSICAGALTTAQHAAITALCRQYMGVP